MWRLLYSESVFIFHVTNSKPARVQRCIQARNFSWPWILTCSSKTETSMPATSCLSTYILYFHIMTLSNHTSVGGTLTFVMRSHADFQYMLLCCFFLCLPSKCAKWESKGLFCYYSLAANGNSFFRLSIKKNIDIQYKSNLYLWCVYKQNTRHTIIKLDSQQKCMLSTFSYKTVCFDL